jgi:hypothetical protein
VGSNTGVGTYSVMNLVPPCEGWLETKHLRHTASSGVSAVWVAKQCRPPPSAFCWCGVLVLSDMSHSPASTTPTIYTVSKV